MVKQMCDGRGRVDSWAVGYKIDVDIFSLASRARTNIEIDEIGREIFNIGGIGWEKELARKKSVGDQRGKAYAPECSGFRALFSCACYPLWCIHVEFSFFSLVARCRRSVYWRWYLLFVLKLHDVFCCCTRRLFFILHLDARVLRTMHCIRFICVYWYTTNCKLVHRNANGFSLAFFFFLPLASYRSLEKHIIGWEKRATHTIRQATTTNTAPVNDDISTDYTKWFSCILCVCSCFCPLHVCACDKFVN